MYKYRWTLIAITIFAYPCHGAIVAFEPDLPLAYASHPLGGIILSLDPFVAITPDYRPSGSGLDIDGNGIDDFFLFGLNLGNSITSVGYVEGYGENQIWSIRGGIAGFDLGTDALAIIGGTPIGPGLSSEHPWIGWHNNDDTGWWSTVGQTAHQLEGATWGDFVTRPGDDFFTGYLMGVRFEREEQIHYGWIEMTWRGAFGLWVNRWAYESDPDTAILAGAIPEPATALLIAGGALFILRRSSKK